MGRNSKKRFPVLRSPNSDKAIDAMGRQIPKEVAANVNTVVRKSNPSKCEDLAETAPVPSYSAHTPYQNKQKDKRPQPTARGDSHPNFKIKEVKGDLFDAPDSVSLAHCVAEDMHMSAGIAIEFRKRFGKTGELLDQNKKMGQVAVLENKGRFIYYLVTKRISQSKPHIKSVESSLREMSEHVEQHGVKDIAMPMIGCGLDMLDWDEVFKLIREIFQHLDVKITIYEYNKTLAPEAVPVTLKSSFVQLKKGEKLDSMNPVGTLFLKLAGADSSDAMGLVRNEHNVKFKKLKLICLNEYGQIKYQSLQECLRHLKKSEEYYVGIEILSQDLVDIKKLENILKFSLYNKEIWIYCPNFTDKK